MKRASSVLPVLSVLLLGCATTSGGSGKPEGSPASAEDQAKKVQELERKLEIARARLNVARLELEAFDEQLAVQIRHASAESDMARASLGLFQEATLPNRLATEELGLRTARDRAQEAVEELAQIEIMYDEQDLDDLTAEFVVSRGRRNAERAAARLAIQEAELRALEERELPQEQAKLELALDKSVAGLAKTEREGDIGREGKVIAICEKENEVAELEEELAELMKEAKP